MRTKYTKVKKMWAEMGYQGRNLKNHIKEEYDIDIEIVKRPPCRFWVHKDTPPELLPTREQGFIALFTIIRTDRNMLLACYSHKHISYRIRTIIRKAIKYSQEDGL